MEKHSVPVSGPLFASILPGRLTPAQFHEKNGSFEINEDVNTSRVDYYHDDLHPHNQIVYPRVTSSRRYN